ncbi:MAG TPA: LytTR family DNA-binding domain-containing protein [Bacteroidia bacterium]|nr:LytTR family DNA-binding domain-containing protein [Bacteroidia bacterium]
MKSTLPAPSAEHPPLPEEFFFFLKFLKQEKKIILRSKTEIRVVALKEIIRLHIGGHHTVVYIKDKPEFTCCRTLDSFEAELHEYDFCRVHDNCIVNLHEVERYVFADNLITLKNGITIDASRSKGKDLVARLEKIF